jgi:capsular polysaccharide biosynthesis protein
VGTANSDNYYSWMLESLPRWRMIQASGWADYDLVLLHSRPARFQDETLNRLGVPVAKRLRLSKNFVYQFECLVVPEMPYPLRQITPWTCEWLRSLFPERAGGPSRIYLSRRGAQRRRMVNETELEERLIERGFVSVQPETMTVAEQAELFSGAAFVVAPHGAGVTNMVFAPRGASLLELFHPDNLNQTYRNLATACGLRYASLIGRRTRELARADDTWAEFEVDIPEVLKILSKQGA